MIELNLFLERREGGDGILKRLAQFEQIGGVFRIIPSEGGRHFSIQFLDLVLSIFDIDQGAKFINFELAILNNLNKV